MNYTEIFEKLWDDYRAINPSVDKIHKLLESRGDKIINDHVAFRTYDLPGINIDALKVPFIEAGYVERGKYNFDKKKLSAVHFEHKTDELAPKVFISELRTKEFSALVRETAKWVTRNVKKAAINPKDLIFSKRTWEPINYASYEALRSESEYAAWMYVYGFRANHFTVFINHLKSIDSIESLNDLLKESGFVLNTSGGEIKGSEQEYLKQSSTLADNTLVKFETNEVAIPCCYYEFAERFADDSKRLFSGFIAQSADKIFESTDKH